MSRHAGLLRARGWFQGLDALEAPRPALQGLGVAALLGGAFGSVRRTGRGPERPPRIGSQVDEGEVRGAGVLDLAGPRDLAENLHPDLERGCADVIEPGLERDHLVGVDR